MQRLSGGYTNFTIRAWFHSPVDVQSRQIYSAVLEYAQPFIATAPDQPVHRQVIETGINPPGKLNSGFLSDLYGLTTNPSAEVLALLSNPFTTSDTYEFLANTTKTTLIQANVPDAVELAAHVHHCLQEVSADACLGMVDLWPESILVDPEGNCGLVD
ncbi:hypothetical protein Hypma_004184 [Hypsizygus marmoreus]|uniref:Uncharacterized protein n=1 Tax=Hypsizygus marmoreus TaxID=39966 RepID=A0A369J4C4_HYPMA|nr:hypothetical protein Hypma_004184 [Hypsizygus marmoreus]